MLNPANVETFLDTALDALGSGNGFEAVLDVLPVPIYITDSEGAVTYWNRACVKFAGREPQLGQDRWCVTWRLYSASGDFIPHDQCPMAEAIERKQPVRGKIAIALRPDGSRAAFRPYPTPLFDGDGKLTGAVNMLVDISAEQAGALSQQADRCRRLSRATHDKGAADMLEAMATGYADTADALRG